jgi:DNA-binding response OmpR family regulator
MAAAEVLVVEDAPEYAELVTAILRQAGHSTRTAGTGAAALAALGAVDPDVIVLDLTLPDIDGLDLCQSIRGRSDAYIIVVTARDDEVDKILGLKLGADDYVTKPFSPRELAARVEALLRRPRASRGSDGARRGDDERRAGEVVIRPAAREVEVAGNPVELTKIEFAILEALTENPKIVLTREVLRERVWGADWFGDDHVVDVHIANLRKKIDRPGVPSLVRTVRGVGYGIRLTTTSPGD